VSYEEEQRRKKLEKLDKLKEHQKSVAQQIEDRSKLLKAIGSKVIVGN
jgi:hypothetical protein